MNIIKEPVVLQKVSISHTTLYRLMKAGKFPHPIKLSPNRVGWLEDDVTNWIEEQQKKSLIKHSDL